MLMGKWWLFTTDAHSCCSFYDIKCTCRSIIRLNTNENEAKAFLEEYNTKYGALLNAYVIAAWNYETNLTDANANQIVYNF